MQEFEQLLGYKFKNRELLLTALTHSSFANEKHCTSYERLEYLGDSVLGLIVSEYLYKNLKKEDEGELSKIRSSLVCEESLVKVADRLNISEHLRLGRGTELEGGRKRKSITSDVVEAVIAAIYLDSNLETAKKCVMNLMGDELKGGLHGEYYHDFKTMLQEKLQKKSHTVATYKLIGEEGPAHSKFFKVMVMSDGTELAEGSGISKKDAEQDAAKNALKKMGERV